MKKVVQSVPGAEPADEDTVQVLDVLLEEAGRLGFALVSYQTEIDQTVWEWRQGDGPRPQFVTERVARQWMAEWLARQPAVARPQPLDDRRRDRDRDLDRDGTAERVSPVAESA